MIRERCGCGAEFETDEPKAEVLWIVWRTKHECFEVELPDKPQGGTAQVEQAPDYTMPEMHIGFRS